MIKQKLTAWEMEWRGQRFAAQAPCSLYSVLLAHKKIDDPFYRLNEKAATALSEEGMELYTRFTVTEEMLEKAHVALHILGVDTLCEAYLGGEHLISMDNMHREWRAEVTGRVHAGENELRLCFRSPSEHIRRKNAEHYLYTSTAGGADMVTFQKSGTV
jgi:beta-mannosidase